MTTASWPLQQIAQLLAEQERVAVLGDLEEAGTGTWQSSRKYSAC